jgi:hypothetical protein
MAVICNAQAGVAIIYTMFDIRELFGVIARRAAEHLFLCFRR